MIRTIAIGGVECRFKSSAAIPRMYRMKFGRDIFVDMQKIQKQVEIQKRLREETEEEPEEEIGRQIPIESLEMFENIAYLMHKHGDKDQPQDIDEWLEQFETFDIYEVLPEIMEMWKAENRQTSTAKKKSGK